MFCYASDLQESGFSAQDTVDRRVGKLQIGDVAFHRGDSREMELRLPQVEDVASASKLKGRWGLGHAQPKAYLAV